MAESTIRYFGEFVAVADAGYENGKFLAVDAGNGRPRIDAFDQPPAYLLECIACRRVAKGFLQFPVAFNGDQHHADQRSRGPVSVAGK